MNIDRSV
jgi:hypothetical protein